MEGPRPVPSPASLVVKNDDLHFFSFGDNVIVWQIKWMRPRKARRPTLRLEEILPTGEAFMKKRTRKRRGTRALNPQPLPPWSPWGTPLKRSGLGNEDSKRT